MDRKELKNMLKEYCVNNIQISKKSLSNTIDELEYSQHDTTFDYIVRYEYETGRRINTQFNEIKMIALYMVENSLEIDYCILYHYLDIDTIQIVGISKESSYPDLEVITSDNTLLERYIRGR